MDIVNRGYIIVWPKKAFTEWANARDEDFFADPDGEPTIYLIDEDFYDDEAVLKANFKNILINELFAVSDDEESFPEISMETFCSWFRVELGATVMDTLSRELQKGEI